MWGKSNVSGVNVFAPFSDEHYTLDAMQTILGKIHEDLERDAEEVFQNLGLDSATAIRVFLRKVVATRSIPFMLEEDPFFSAEEEDEILAAAEEARGDGGIRTNNLEETQAVLDSMKYRDGTSSLETVPQKLQISFTDGEGKDRRRTGAVPARSISP